MNVDDAFSRPAKTALGLGDLAEDRHRFLDKKVLLTGEAPILALPNGRGCFLDSLRLLIRVCRNIFVLVPQVDHDLHREAVALAEKIAFGSRVEFLKTATFERFDAVLSVGTKAHPDLPWTTINSNGFVARVTSGGADLPSEYSTENPVGALAAASLGAGEVFKRLIRVKHERAEMLDGYSFSLLTYQMCGDAGPELPLALDRGLLVVGAGAIGNGIVHLLSQLPVRGKVTIVDRQEYGVENLGTCILMSPEQVKNTPKARALADILTERGIQAEGIFDSFDRYAEKLKIYPEVVLNGLDNIDVRHEVQRSLWPNVVIDGAIGDFTCQVSRHPWPDDVACLICMFRKSDGRPAHEIQSAASGLPSSRLADPDSLVTQADVEAAPPEKRDFLRRYLGKPVCSVVQNAMAQAISEEKQRTDFEPSVPFVATFSACMVVTEALIRLCGWKSKLEPRFQFDFLIGPANGQELPQARREQCLCRRNKNIELVRGAHRLGQ